MSESREERPGEEVAVTPGGVRVRSAGKEVVVRASGEERLSKDITIRGLNPELYNSVAELSRRLGISIGEAINEAMKLLLDVMGGLRSIQPLVEGVKEAGKSISEGISNLTPVPISGIEEIELSKEDFEKFGRRVLISNVRKVVFSQDVDEATLEKYVAVIRDCDEVSFPKSISKLLALSKCRDVDRVTFY
ncbi:hypothetical protein D9Q81_07775 [Candidatus Korarchaeum cryptofilum]|jgi:hypothetical protein|uniref:Uncharacterized protein n=1 Tax=Candidatus Korarchaeum cryptofilum TaxID=498846 RepID=A0A3R9P9B3_9CREN|nr:hypothetical protein [Candidatus Korarchaeum cryptofilum]RSN67683.1 hypothetical protein D9Q81_07775 [Candidatus Korarchaeum cryptofilum]